MKTQGIGVIGCGARTQGLSSRAKRIGLEIKAFCDIEKEKAVKFKKQHAPEAKIYDDYKELVKDPEIDWVLIGSCNSMHAEQTIAAFEAGKNVFCEKPLAISMKQCAAVKKAHEKSGKKLMIGFTLRYSSMYRKIKELLDGGTIGRILSFEFNETLNFNHGGHIMCCWRRKRETTGCHILEKCCHDIDIANWLTDSRAKRVASFGGLNFFTPENAHHREKLSKSKEGHPAYCTWPSAHGKNPFTTDKDIIDNQVAIIEYENGVRATFHTNLNAGIPERRLYILGTEGAIRFDLCKGEIEIRKIGFEAESEFITNKGVDGHGGGDDILIGYWKKMIEEGAPSLTDLKTGLEAAVTCFAIDDAMLKNKIVCLDPYWEKLEI